jgi:hypothetical protein
MIEIPKAIRIKDSAKRLSANLDINDVKKIIEKAPD